MSKSGLNEGNLDSLERDLDFIKTPLDKLKKELEDAFKVHYAPEDWWGGGGKIETKNKSLDLETYRKDWEEKMNEVDPKTKEKIKEAVGKIAVDVKEERDGSRLIEFQLKNKTYKILDPTLNTHTDEEYKIHAEYNSIGPINKDYVTLWWMEGNVDEWKNQKLKAYVKQKESEWLHIAKIEEMKDLLRELWKEAWLTKETDQVAMLMYLTWMDGSYWLAMWDDKVRFRLDCDDASDGNECIYPCEDPFYDASLLMIN